MQSFGVRLASLLASLLIVFVPQATGDISSLDRFLPPDTVLYFAVKDLSAAKEAAHKTAFYEVWDSAGMKALRTDMSTLWKESVVRKIKIDPLTLLQAVKKDLVFGTSFHYDATLGMPRGMSLSWVLAIDDPEGEIKKIVSTIKTVMMFAGDSGPGLKSFKHLEADVASISIGENAEVSVVTMPGVALVCMGVPGLVTTLIDQGASEDPAGFPTSEAYPSLLGFHKKGDLSLGWVDARHIVQTAQILLKTVQDDVDPMLLFRHVGLDNCSYLFFRNYIDHRGFLTEQILGFDGPIHGLLQFFFHAGELKAVERFTPEVDFVMDMSHGSFDEAWRRLQDTVKVIGGDKAFTQMNAAVQAFETMLGFSFEKDLFSSIGNETAMAVMGERFTLLAQVRDEKKIAEVIPKLLMLWELQPETVEAEEISYSRVEIPWAGIALFFGVDRGYLTVSNSPEGYLSALKDVSKEKSIVGSRRYGKALSYLPAANSTISITDLRGMANYTSTMMNLQQAISGNAAGGGLDLSFLAEETFPIVEVGVTQEDRYIRWSYSESGMEYFLGVFSTLNAILPRMASEEGKRAVSRCQADLRSIMTALEGYFLDNDRYPETLDNLLEPIAYLAKVPTDPWTGEPYIYKCREETYILVGAGPNRKIDLDVESIEGPFTSEKIPEGARYDPATGTGGDIIIVGP